MGIVRKTRIDVAIEHNVMHGFVRIPLMILDVLAAFLGQVLYFVVVCAIMVSGVDVEVAVFVVESNIVAVVPCFGHFFKRVENETSTRTAPPEAE